MISKKELVYIIVQRVQNLQGVKSGSYYIKKDLPQKVRQ